MHHHPHHSVDTLRLHGRQQELVALLDRALPKMMAEVEYGALYLLVSAFFGLVIYMALLAL